ncbi:MAG TPA: response regulator [Pirellulales bacterium]|nr:response regulator [Pirellulales bacterium]
MDSKRPVEILFVEDSPSDARLVAECFRDSEIPNRLHTVIDGEEALDFLHQEVCYADSPRPDLVLLDLDIPKVHGLVVLDAIKRNPNLKNIPVIVLTASAIAEDVHQAYHLQANSYLSKPTDLDGFIEMVHSIERHWLKHATLAPAEAEDPATTAHEQM